MKPGSPSRSVALAAALMAAAVAASAAGAKNSGTTSIVDDLTGGSSGSTALTAAGVELEGALGQTAVGVASLAGTEAGGGFFAPAVTAPANVAVTGVEFSSITLGWNDAAPANPVGTVYVVELSTAPDFTGTLVSSQTVGFTVNAATLAANATHYIRIRAEFGGAEASPYVFLSTASAIETPTAVVFEAVRSSVVVVSAYVAGPAFSSMTAGMSGANVALGAAYAGWGKAGWSSFGTPGFGRFSAAGAELDGRFYILGGNAGGDLTNVDMYDPVLNAWFPRAGLLSARNGLGAAAAGGRLYAVAGYSGGDVTNVESYDPEANQWTARAPLPVAAHNHAVSAVAGKVYAMGGDPPTANNYEYDPDANTWTARLALPTARGGAAAAVLDGKIYLTAGFNSGFADTKRLDRYDPATNTWAPLADLPSVRNSHGSAALGGKIWVLGGMDGTYLASVVRYDPAADSWASEAPMPTARRSMAVAAVGGKIYAVTGFNGASLSTSERYDAGVTSSFTALSPNTLYSFRAKARNSVGVETGETLAFSTYTLAVASLPLSGTELFGAVGSTSMVVSWSSGTMAGGFNGINATYMLQASTKPNFIPVLSSSFTAGISAVLNGLLPNVTHYFRLRAHNALGVTDNSWFNLGSTVTAIQTPTEVYFDEVSSHSLTAAAYAPTPAFSGLDRGLSGTNISLGGTYAGWHGEKWTTRAAVPSAREHTNGAAVGGRIFVLGGNLGAATPTASMQAYDTLTGAWTVRASMGAARWGMGVAAVGGRLHAAAGDPGVLSLHESYDPAQNAWDAAASLPSGRSSAAGVSLGGQFYALGPANQNDRFDPATGLWQSRAAMTVSMSPGAAALFGKLYAVGGLAGDMLEYDPGADGWTARASMPTGRTGVRAAALGGKVYVSGGLNGTYLAVNEEFDPRANAWTARLPLPTARQNHAWVPFGGRLYAVGGGQASPLDSHEEYDPGVASSFTALTPNTQYFFKAKARNLAGVETAETTAFSTYTLAVTSLPLAGGPVFLAAFPSSVTLNWSSGTLAGGFNGPGATYLVQASTMAAFFPVAGSSLTANISATVGGLFANATHFFRVRAYNSASVTDYSWFILGSTVTAIEAPTSVFFDEVSSHSITASAYAAGPAFSRMSVGLSGTNVSLGGSYQGWHGESWTTKTGMTTARYGLAASAVAGKLYAVGGQNGVALAVNEEYDPAANTWIDKAAMLTARIQLTASAVGGKVYAVGGHNGSALVANEEYDPVANTWTAKAAMPTTRFRLAASAVGGKLYAVGGDNGPYLATIEEYDPATNAWTGKAAMPTPRTQAAASTVGGKLYVMGGYNGSNLATNEEYDPAANAWTGKAAMLTARGELAASPLGGKLYAVGGSNGPSRQATNEEYDPVTDVWRGKAAMPTARYGLAASAVGGKLFALGGNDVAILATNEAYDPGVASSFTALTPNTLYAFRAKARNSIGVETVETTVFSTYTLAAATLPLAGTPVFGEVFPSSITVNWASGTVAGGFNGPGATYLVQASTKSTFIPVAGSSLTAAISATIEGLFANATHYFRVRAYNAANVTDHSWFVLGSTHTPIQAPTGVYFDQVTTHSVTASAYAATPAFSSMTVGLSGTNVARSGSYAGWHGEKWTAKAAMTTARLSMAAGVVGGRVYVVGGENISALSANEEYDPASNQWTARAVMPTARYNLAVGVVEGRLYAFGGSNGSFLSVNEEYDPTGNSWTAKAAMPTARMELAAGVIGGKVYAVGGNAGTPVSVNEEYDPAADLWTAKAAMPTARKLLGAGVVGARLYAIAGVNGPFQGANEEYDPQSNSWTPKAAIPTPRERIAVGGVAGKLYALGGYTGAASAANEEYDPTADTWTTRAPMPTARYGAGAGAIGGKIYAFGGYNGGYLATNEEYDPGVASSFTALTPNTQYFFRAKSRNSAGWETVESPVVSTYTLAAATVPQAGAPIFSPVHATSMTVNWSSGTSAGGYNGGGATYLVQASTMATFAPVAGSSLTAASLADIEGLSANATYYARVRAINSLGVPNDWFSLGSTVTLANPALSAASTYTMVGLTSMTVTWDANSNAAGTRYDVFFTTHFPFSNVVSVSTNPYGTPSATAAGLLRNATYYPFVFVYNRAGVESGQTALGSTATRIETPSTVLLPVVTTHSIVAVASSPVGAFSNLDQSSSAVNIARNGVYQDWVAGSSVTVSSGLTPNTQYSFKAKARNLRAVETEETSAVSAYTLAFATVAQSGDPAFTAVFSASATVAWSSGTPAGGYNGPGALYVLAVSTRTDFTPVAASSTTRNPYATVTGLYANATHYFRLKAYNTTAVTDDVWILLGSTVTPIESPSSVFFDEVTTHSIVAVASVPVPGFTGLALGGSAVNISLGGSYQGWVAGSSVAVSTGLTPNTQYSFKAKARNQMGAETVETAVVSTYTLAAAPSLATPSFVGVFLSSVSLQWQASGNPGATPYRVRASTAAGFTGAGDLSSAWFTGTSTETVALGFNTTYYFRVRARNGDLIETADLIMGATVTMAAEPLSAASTYSAVASTSFGLAWLANGNPAGTLYEARASTAVQPNSLPTNVDLTTRPATSPAVVFPGLVPNTTYYAAVRAISHAGPASPVLLLGATVTVAEPPVASTSPLAGVFLTSMTVQWSSGTNPAWTQYRVDAATSADYGGLLWSTDWNAFTSTTVAGLTRNSTYYLRVQARTVTGVPTAFLALGATATLANDPVDGGNPFPTVLVSSLTASWATAGNPSWTRYEAVVSTVNAVPDGSADEVKVATTGPSSALLTGLVPNSTQYLFVRALNLNSVPSDWAALGSTVTRIESPMGVYFNELTTHSIVAVASAPAFTNLSIPVSAVNIGLGGVFQGWVAGSSVTVSTGLTPNTAYAFRAKARNLLAIETPETVDVTTYTLAAVPSTATPPFPVVWLSSLAVQWTANANPAPTEYRLETSTAADWSGASDVLSAWASGTSTAAAGLAVNATYYFRVQARNFYGAETQWRTLGSTVTGADKPAPPAGSSFTLVAQTSATLAWGLGTNPPDTEFQVRASTAGNFSGVDRFSAWAAAQAATVTSLNADTTYYWRVTARNRSGAESEGREFGAQATAPYDPAASSAPFHDRGSSSATVQWGAGGNPPGTVYEAQLSTSGAFGGDVRSSGWVAFLSTTVVGLTGDSTYYLRVRARGVGGTVTGWTALASSPTLAADPSSLSAASVGPGSLRAEWGSGGNREADSLGAWSARTSLPAALERQGTALLNGRLYAVGGVKAGAPTSEVWSAGVSPVGTLGAWRRETDLPAPRESLGVAAFGGRLYAVGGFDGSARSTVYVAEVSPDGRISLWNTDTALPAARAKLAVVAEGGWLYAFGGDNGVVSQTTVYRSALDRKGKVVGWAAATALPAARNSHSAAVSSGRVYVAGGLGAGVEEEVWSAALAGPTVGAWRVETPLPTAVFRHALLASGGALVIVGGHDGTGAVAAVRSARLLSGGVLGAWEALEALPAGRFGHGAALETGNILVAGGADDSAAVADSYQAALGGTEYLLERAQDGEFAVDYASSNWRAGAGAELAGLTPNTAYFLRLRVRSRAGAEGALLVTPSTRTPAAVPASAASTFSLVEAGSMTLTWASGGNPPGTEFFAAVSTSVDFTTSLNTGWVAALSSAVFGLTPNTSYFAGVVARDVDGNGTREVYLGSTVTAAAVPQSPSFPTVVTTGLSVEWSTAGNPSGTRYEAQLAAASSFASLAASTVTTSTGTSFTGLLSASTYYFRVRAFNRLATPTGFSATTSAVTGADFTPPAAAGGLGLHATETPGVLLAAWTSPGDDGGAGILPAGSRIYFQWSAADPASVAWSTANAQLSAATGPVTPGAPASLVVTGLPAGSSVYARVWTLDESDNVSAPSAVASVWASPFTSTRLDGSGQDAGRWASVALDRLGGAHAAYTAGTITQELRYMTRSGGVWSVAEAPDAGIPAEEVVLAMGPTYPQVAYRNSSTGQLRLAKRTSGWSAAAVASGNLHPGGLAVDATSYAHISYFDEAVGLRYARWNGASWDLETVDAGGGRGRFSSLALDGASAPHIAYYDATAGDLKYASRTAAGTWSVSTVDSAVDVGSAPVVALDGNGHAAVAYLDTTSQDLKFARFDGTAWSLSLIDSPRDVAAVRGLALDGAGRPVVTYYDGTNGDFLLGRYNGTGWETGAVETFGDVGAWSGVALETDGSVLELHYDAAAADLRAGTWNAGLPAVVAGNPRGRSQAPAAFSGVVFSSVGIQWTWVDSAAAELGWRLYGATVSTGPFSVVAGTTALPATAGTGIQRSYTETGLTSGTTYYRYVVAVSSGGVVPSPMAALFPFDTVDVTPPTATDNQAGDSTWRRSSGTLYDVDFQDNGGSALAKFQVKAATVAGGAGPDVVGYTDVVVGILADGYTANWALPAAVFNALHDGATNYVTVRVFDGAGNAGVLADVFTVLKDTTPPTLADNQAGDAARRAAGGTLYDVDALDPASGLDRFQYSVSTTLASGDAARKGWTDIPLGAGATSYILDWAVDFAALLGDSPNYVSVRAWDRAGSTVTLTDAFSVMKDTGGPRVAVTAPAAAFRSVMTVLAGTAADDAGVGGVQVAVQTAPPTGNWFDGAAFTAGGPFWLSASGLSTWTFAGVPAWTDGGAFRVVARASDTLGNFSVGYATADFTFDSSTPTAGVTSPANGATLSVLANLAGTASDPGGAASGLARIDVEVRRAADGFYWGWSAGAWAAGQSSTSPALSATWSLALPEGLRSTLAHGASYFVAARALDGAVPANTGSLAAGSTFTWTDTAAPSAVTNLSALTGAGPGLLNLTWTAPGDDGAAGDVSLGSYRIHYSTIASTVFSSAAAQVEFSTSGVKPGAFQGRVVSGLSAGATYHVRIFMADDAGNWSALSNGATAYAGNQPFNKIIGHVMKASSEGITAVKLEAYDSSEARVSQAFTLADGSGTFSLNGIPDGVFRVLASWTADDITSSVWLDNIAVGSFDVDFMLEINYSLSTLTGTLSTLAAQTASRPGFMTRASENNFGEARVDLLRGGEAVAAVRPDPTGRWNIPNLLPGRYAVRAFNGLDYTDPQDVQLGEGETREVVFVFDPLPEASVFAFPNPARTQTTFRLISALPDMEAQVTVFDIAGNLVKEIPGSAFVAKPGGLYHAAWDLTNDQGESVASGVYLFMVKVKGSNGQSGKVVKKLAVVR